MEAFKIIKEIINKKCPNKIILDISQYSLIKQKEYVNKSQNNNKVILYSFIENFNVCFYLVFKIILV